MPEATKSHVETFATESVEVAATFAAMRLAERAVTVNVVWRTEQRAAEFGNAFAIVYAAIREAQTAVKGNEVARSVGRQN